MDTPSTSHSNTSSTSVLVLTPRTSKFVSPQRLSGDMKKHKVTKILGSGTKNRYVRRPYIVCAAGKKRSGSSFMCAESLVPLHFGQCFQKYHTCVKYYNFCFQVM
ncbi:hypothetical protein M0802_016668 [Mischocyttarus mexicanus]|nr:hypothetical protein M0802_016668 [Mischocyttarus mexicanus]